MHAMISMLHHCIYFVLILSKINYFITREICLFKESQVKIKIMKMIIYIHIHCSKWNACVRVRVFSCTLVYVLQLRIFLPMHNYYSLSMLVSWTSILDICTSLSVCETITITVYIRCLHSFPI